MGRSLFAFALSVCLFVFLAFLDALVVTLIGNRAGHDTRASFFLLGAAVIVTFHLTWRFPRFYLVRKLQLVVDKLFENVFSMLEIQFFNLFFTGTAAVYTAQDFCREFFQFSRDFFVHLLRFVSLNTGGLSLGNRGRDWRDQIDR